MSGELTTELGSLDDALDNLDDMDGSEFDCVKCEDGTRRSAATKEVKFKEHMNGHVPQKVVWVCRSCGRTVDTDPLMNYK